MKIKVLFLIDKLTRAGTQTHLLELVRHRDRKKFEPYVVSLVEGGELVEDFKALDVDTRVLSVKRAYGISGVQAVRWLASFMKEKKIDLVQTHFLHADLIGLAAAKLAGVKKIITTRRDQGFWRTPRHLVIMRLLNPLYDHILANSSAVEKTVLSDEGVSASRISVIHNGIPISKYAEPEIPSFRKNLGIASTDLVIGTVGNMRHDIKGQRYLLEAAEQVLKEIPKMKLVLVGDGPLRPQYEEQAKKLGIEEQVLFLGLRADIPAILKAIDIFCLPSLTEGFSNAILEAMASLKPVVATRVGGNPEMISDETTGYLVPPRDADALAYRLTLLLKNEKLRKQMGKAGRDHVMKTFTAEKMARQYESFYENLMRGERGGGNALPPRQKTGKTGDSKQSSVLTRSPVLPFSHSPLLAIIASQFPETHETFVLKEFLALKREGVRFQIYSLKPCHDRIIQSEAQPLMKDTAYVTSGNWRTWFEACLEFVRHPFKSIQSLQEVISSTPFDEVRILIKNLGVWFLALACAYKMRKADTVHIHAHWATVPTTAARVASQHLGIGYSFTAHAWDLFVPHPDEIKIKVSGAKKIITCTDYNRRYLTELCPESADKIVCNYHGVDLLKFSKGVTACRSKEFTSIPQNLNTPLLISVGRLVETKGYPLLIEAYRLLKQKGIVFRAMIIGDGTMKERLMIQLHSSGLGARVTVHSTMPQSEVKSYYEHAYLFVLPCIVAANGDRDGIPNVAMEAMAMGVPVVSTTVSGLPELIEDGKDGWLVPEKDAEALAKALEELLLHPEKVQAAREKALQKISEKFDDRKHLSELAGMLKALIKENEESRQQAIGNRQERKDRKQNPVGRKETQQVLPTADSQLPTIEVPVLRSTPFTRSPVRILFMIWSLEAGGAERVVMDLAAGLDRHIYEPIVLCLNQKGRLAHELESKGIRVLELYKKPKLDFSVVPKLTEIFRREKIDLVHTHLFTANSWGRLACALSGIPVIATEHNVDLWKKNYHFWLDRALAPVSRRLICVSHKVHRFYAEKIGVNGNAKVIYNGIDIQRYAKGQTSGKSALKKKLGFPDPALVLGAVGRLVPVKRHKDFIEAVRILNEHGFLVCGVIVGGGPLEAELRQKIREENLEKTVILTGPQNEVAEYYQLMDLFVLCSEQEGLPLAMLEAMAAEIPIVATRVGGIEECLRDQQEGLLVHPGSPQILADAIGRILENPKLKNSLVKKAKERLSENFSVNRMLTEHQKLYEEVLTQEPRSIFKKVQL